MSAGARTKLTTHVRVSTPFCWQLPRQIQPFGRVTTRALTVLTREVGCLFIHDNVVVVAYSLVTVWLGCQSILVCLFGRLCMVYRGPIVTYDGVGS